MSLLHLEPRPISTAGVQETRAFSMKANGKAFKVLIDGLYSDKIRAVIREIASNAYDAQVAAGRGDQPFEMHLPTAYEPWFSVRDFGTSMTHEEVMGLYTTVFESSKESSTTQVGKLGLGSKSPFAYNDTFTVTAYLAGQMRTYSAYVGADYIPQISLMSWEPTSEPDGLEVSFPTRPDDVHAFGAAATFTLRGFDVLPRQTGASVPANVRGEAILQGNGWALYRDLGASLARQGCVVYPITPSAFAAYGSIYDSGVIVDFPIGALEISASREGLGYDEETIKNLRAAQERISAEMTQIAMDKLHALTTMWDRMVYLRDLTDADVPGRVIDALRQEVFGNNWTSSIDVPVFSLGAASMVSYNRTQLHQTTRPKRPSSPGAIEFNCDAVTLVVWNDSARGPITHAWERIRQHAASSRIPWTRAYAVSYDSRVRDTKAEVLHLASGAPADWFVDLHDLPAPPKAPRGSSAATIKARLVARRDIKRWEAVDVDLKAGGYYVPLYRFKVENHCLSGQDADDIVGHLKALGEIPGDAQVYGLPRASVRKGWVNIIDLAKATLKAREVEIVHMARVMDAANARHIGLDGLEAHLPEAHPLIRFKRMQDDVRSESQRRNKPLRALASEFQFHGDPGLVPRFPTWEDATKDYPLLRGIDEINDDNILDVVDYVNLVDSRAANRQIA